MDQFPKLRRNVNVNVVLRLEPAARRQRFPDQKDPLDILRPSGDDKILLEFVFMQTSCCFACASMSNAVEIENVRDVIITSKDPWT
ncbi:MAG: hypothetical protein ACRC7H_04695, partial [Plesiomonas shigelloides]